MGTVCNRDDFDGERILVEASPEDDPRALDPAQWLGRNLLGYALMEVRRLIRAGEEPPAFDWLEAPPL